jgi:hypothetical protein
MKPSFVKCFLCGVSIAVLSAALPACQKTIPPRVAPENSQLKKATDVFWALYNLGYAISKESPNPSPHGCIPFEYLAQKEKSTFRISVFECPNVDQARALVEHPKTRDVDGLLRNRGEGGILQRGPLEIVVRMNEGRREATEELLDKLGGM